MRWSWKIGEVEGIGIYIHATFALIFLWVIFSYSMAGQPVAATIDGMLFVCALFACVVLHELGHALTAKSFGIHTRDITLLPIGGVARLEKMPEKPSEELLVALAGPAVNVVIAFGLFLVLGAFGFLAPLSTLSITGGGFWQRLAIVNIFLALFNLIPAFPMDGGRILRAVLATQLEYTKATVIAASVGQFLALAFGLFGLIGGNPILVLIAFFVWVGAGQESAMVQMKSVFGAISVASAMVTEFKTLNPTDTLQQAVGFVLAGSQHDFPVLYGDEPIGILLRQDMISALSQRGPDALVQDVMQREFQQADASEMLDSAFQRLQTCNCHTMIVKRNGQVVGLLTTDNVGEFVMIHSAISASRSSQAPDLADKP